MWRLILKVNCKRRSSWVWDREADNCSIKQVDWVPRASVSLLTQLLGSSSRPGFSPFSRKCDQPKRKGLKILTLKVRQRFIDEPQSCARSFPLPFKSQHMREKSRATEENLKLERERSTNWPTKKINQLTEEYRHKARRSKDPKPKQNDH